MSVTSKKKIGVYLNRMPQAGGSYHYLFFILDALSCQIDKLDILGFCHVDIWKETVMRRYPDIKAVMLPKDLYSAIETMDSYNCDAIIYPMDGADASSSMMLKTPVINVIHDIMCFYEKSFATHRGYDYAYMYQMFCRHSIGVFTDSDLGREQIMHVCGHLYQDKIYVLPFRPCKYLEEEEPEEPVALKNEKFFFYPANFGYHKNHLNLLMAMEQLREEGIVVNFLFTGQGQSGAAGQIKRVIKAFGLEEQVDITGGITNPQMKYLYKHARAMVMPTYDGPTNIPPVESLYMGCPVAVSNLYAMPWQVGDAGLVFNPDSVEDIVLVLRRLWLDDDLCCEMRERGYQRIKSLSATSFSKRFAEGLSSMLKWSQNMCPNLKALYQSCKGRKVYIYGAGQYGCAAYEYFGHKNVDVVGFVVSDGHRNTEYYLGLPVFLVEDIKPAMDSAIIVLALRDEHLDEVQEVLRDRGFDESMRYVFGHEHAMEWFYYKMNS